MSDMLGPAAPDRGRGHTPTASTSPATRTTPSPAQGTYADGDPETFNPWSVVNLVFQHLADEGLHPVLGAGDPGRPAEDLLRALGVTPTVQGNRHVKDDVHDQLAALRAAFDPAHPSPDAQEP